MHGVAAKVAEEISVLLQHHDLDAGASQEIAEHHAGRPAADDAAADFHRARGGLLIGRGCIHDPTPAAASLG